MELKTKIARLLLFISVCTITMLFADEGTDALVDRILQESGVEYFKPVRVLQSQNCDDQPVQKGGGFEIKKLKSSVSKAIKNSCIHGARTVGGIVAGALPAGAIGLTAYCGLPLLLQKCNSFMRSRGVATEQWLGHYNEEEQSHKIKELSHRFVVLCCFSVMFHDIVSKLHEKSEVEQAACIPGSFDEQVNKLAYILSKRGEFPDRFRDIYNQLHKYHLNPLNKVVDRRLFLRSLRAGRDLSREKDPLKKQSSWRNFFRRRKKAAARFHLPKKLAYGRENFGCAPYRWIFRKRYINREHEKKRRWQEIKTIMERDPESLSSKLSDAQKVQLDKLYRQLGADEAVFKILFNCQKKLVQETKGDRVTEFLSRNVPVQKFSRSTVLGLLVYAQLFGL